MSELVSRGSGPAVLFIHGSATDHLTWTVQMASLKDLRLLTYDRRGTASHPVAEGTVCTVEQHADDAAGLLAAIEPCVVVGSSFGAIVALDLARRYPERVTSLVLCEPPLSQSDFIAAVPDGFACRFDALVAQEGGPAAAEFFLRSVLGDESFERMPKAFRHRSMAAWQQIRTDMLGLGRYQVGYHRLRHEIRCPVLLLGGERSASFYFDTLEALHFAIPRSELRVLRGAGHMMHVEAHRQFNAIVREVAGG